MTTPDLGFYIAIAACGLFALVGFLANPVARATSKPTPEWRPDYEANAAARWQG